MRFLASLLLVVPMLAFADIGTISEMQGNIIEIKRSNSSITGKSNDLIKSMDMIATGSRTNVAITFKDNSKVRITENSRLVIDDFVYDPKKSDAGKAAMKVALGTVRYTSGQIAKQNNQNMDIKTPTATIAVRGTDFAMTVDETGRSLIVLLPSCRDEKELRKFEMIDNCTVGAIDVETDAGFVTLTQAFTATFVTDSQQAPLEPVKVEPSISSVNNNQILKPPAAIVEAQKQQDESKRSRREPGAVLNQDEQRTASKTSGESTTSKEETSLIGANPKSLDGTKNLSDNNCFPFDSCGNEQGKNWYSKVDPERGNIIRIKSGEKLDNVTYAISVNNNDVDTRLVGDGSTKITIRQWNK